MTILKGSVKDLHIIKNATRQNTGLGRFEFSDRYSVFDWGEMPDHIDDKGTCLTLIAAKNFELIERQAFKTHYLGLIDSSNKLCTLDDLLQRGETSNKMSVKVTQIIPISNNYENYRARNNNYLVPLEIIFRNGLPKGSSIFTKLNSAKKNPAQYKKILQQLGLTKHPVENEKLPRAIYDFSTKLEEQDRPLNFEEAIQISGLNMRCFGKLLMTADRVNSIITQTCAIRGLKHWDGKIEVYYHNADIVVADVCGTPDESRITCKGKQISKQPLREFYKTTQWYKDVNTAKTKAKKKGIRDWKSLCKSQPQKLPTDIKEEIANVYRATTNRWLSQKIFNVPYLETCLDKLEIALKNNGV